MSVDILGSDVFLDQMVLLMRQTIGGCSIGAPSTCYAVRRMSRCNRWPFAFVCCVSTLRVLKIS
jgi:hypothetical protein